MGRWGGRHTISSEEFDKKFSNLRLRPQESTGLERETHKAENIEAGLEGGNFNQMWRGAPIGTKAIWRNTSPIARSPWEYENAIKTVKGDSDESDRFDAYPLGSNLSEDQVERGLAENASDFPGNTFTILDSTIQQLRSTGAPEQFLNKLDPLKNHIFIGKPAFTDALREPAQALIQLRAQDPDRYQKLMKDVFNFSKTQASEAEKRAYVKKNIRRWELQIPK